METQTLRLKEKYNKIIATGLLLPKDKISRNGVLYDWDSAVKTTEKIPGLPMMYNHKVDDTMKPVGHYVDAVALEKRPTSGKWQEVWDKTAEELKVPEGVPGVYYEADINPNGEYADSITRRDLRKVSIQVIPSKQETEVDDDGKSYTRAFISDYVESSVVPSPGFMETTMAVLCESFNVKRVESVPDIFNKAATYLYDITYDALGPKQQTKVRLLVKQAPDGIFEKLDEDEKMEDEVSLQEDHMKVGDVVDVSGKQMKVAEITDDGYRFSYAEQQSTANNSGATTTKLPDKEEESLEDENMDYVKKEQYENDMNKVVSILEKMKEQLDADDKELVVDESVVEEEEPVEESAESPQDEDAVNKNLESAEEPEEPKKEEVEEPEEPEEPKKETAESPQDEDAVNKNLESAEEPEEPKKEAAEEEEEEPVAESEDEEEPVPPIEEKLSLRDLDSKDAFGNHLKEVFNFK